MTPYKYTNGTIGPARQVASNGQVYPASFLTKHDDETEVEWIERIATIGVTPVEYEAWNGDLNTQGKGASVETMTDGWLVISYPNPVNKVPVWSTSTREQMYIMPDSPLPPGYTNQEPVNGMYSLWTGETWEYNLERNGSVVRAERDKRIEDIMWRIQRHESETRLGLNPTDDISSLDNYIQQLRDMTKQAGFPTNVEWPVEPA